MMLHYEMTDLGFLTYFLGIQIQQHEDSIFLSQEKYAKNLLTKFGLKDCNPAIIPMTLNVKLEELKGEEKTDAESCRRIICSLMYLTKTRPDLECPVNKIARYVSNPSKQHFDAAKCILCYIQGTTSFGFIYPKGGNGKINEFCDADWGGDIDKRTSTGTYLFLLDQKPISWSFHKQQTIVLSTTEVEYMTLSNANCEAIWLK
ncbi:hypothetical protein KSP39_PZI013119 [Platanthera zijinensis]|uniref:Reverse transcriptase Ty1/copia-type domain-containing protein n=1 Tax=Platanthera zijinensis TaxID=2320716 RepID=A0AAP0G3H3_9ASPA